MLGRSTKKALVTLQSRYIPTKSLPTTQKKVYSRSTQHISSHNSIIINSVTKSTQTNDSINHLLLHKYPPHFLTQWLSAIHRPRHFVPIVGAAFSFNQMFPPKPSSGSHSDEDDDQDQPEPPSLRHRGLDALTTAQNFLSQIQNVLNTASFNANIAERNAQTDPDQRFPTLPPPTPFSMTNILDSLISNKPFHDKTPVDEQRFRDAFAEFNEKTLPLYPVPDFQETVTKLLNSQLHEPGSPIFEYNIDAETVHEKDLVVIVSGDKISDIKSTQIYCIKSIIVIAKLLQQLHTYLEKNGCTLHFAVPLATVEGYSKAMSTFTPENCIELDMLESAAQDPSDIMMGTIAMLDFMKTAEELLLKLNHIHNFDVLGFENLEDEALQMEQDRYHGQLVNHLAVLNSLRINTETMVQRFFNLHLLYKSFLDDNWVNMYMNPARAQDALTALQEKYPNRTTHRLNSSLFQLMLAKAQLFYPLLPVEKILHFPNSAPISESDEPRMQGFMNHLQQDMVKRAQQYNQVLDTSKQHENSMTKNFRTKLKIPLLQVVTPKPFPDLFIPIEEFIGNRVFDISAFESDLDPRYRSFIYAPTFTSLFFSEPLPMCLPTELISRPDLKVEDPEFQKYLGAMQLRKSISQRTPLVESAEYLVDEYSPRTPKFKPSSSLKSPFSRDLVRFAAQEQPDKVRNPQSAKFPNAPKPFEAQKSPIPTSNSQTPLHKVDERSLQKNVHDSNFLSDEYGENQLQELDLDQDQDHVSTDDDIRARLFYEQQAAKDFKTMEHYRHNADALLPEDQYDLPPILRNKSQREFSVFQNFHRDQFTANTGFEFNPNLPTSFEQQYKDFEKRSQPEEPHSSPKRFDNDYDQRGSPRYDDDNYNDRRYNATGRDDRDNRRRYDDNDYDDRDNRDNRRRYDDNDYDDDRDNRRNGYDDRDNRRNGYDDRDNRRNGYDDRANRRYYDDHDNLRYYDDHDNLRYYDDHDNLRYDDNDYDDRDNRRYNDTGRDDRDRRYYDDRDNRHYDDNDYDDRDNRHYHDNGYDLPRTKYQPRNSSYHQEDDASYNERSRPQHSNGGLHRNEYDDEDTFIPRSVIDKRKSAKH